MKIEETIINTIGEEIIANIRHGCTIKKLYEESYLLITYPVKSVNGDCVWACSIELDEDLVVYLPGGVIKIPLSDPNSFDSLYGILDRYLSIVEEEIPQIVDPFDPNSPTELEIKARLMKIGRSIKKSSA